MSKQTLSVVDRLRIFHVRGQAVVLDSHLKWQIEHNDRWLQETRPILEAFVHARTMLDFAVRSGRELAEAPQSLPSANNQ